MSTPDPAQHRRDGGMIGHVERGRFGVASGFPDLGGHSVGPFTVEVVHEHMGTTRRELECDRPAHTLSGAGDHGPMIIQAVRSLLCHGIDRIAGPSPPEVCGSHNAVPTAHCLPQVPDLKSAAVTMPCGGRSVCRKPGQMETDRWRRTAARRRGSIHAVTEHGSTHTDPYLGTVVHVVASRQARPNLPSTGCPFCVGGLEAPEPYDVRSFPNRWPALGEGRCEVVLYTPEHDATFASIGAIGVRRVIDLWAERTAALRAAGAEYVLVFENRGAEVGATISHPHGQIYAYDHVPSRPHRLLTAGWRPEAGTR